MRQLSRNRRRYMDNRAAFVFLLPCMLGFILFMVLPVLASLGISLTEWNFLGGLKSMKWVGLDNYAKLLSGKDGWFSTSFWNTLIFAAVTVPVGLLLGLIMASVFNNGVYGSAAFRFVVFIPYISSIVASLIVWQVVFQPSYGPVNSILMALGVENPPKWFVSAQWAFPLIITFQIWQTLGYNIIVFYAGLKNISPDLYEAATTDGATALQKFRHVTVPMISPTTFFLSTMGIISSFKVFDAIKVATNGGPGKATSVVAFYIYREAFENYRMGTASAAAWVMFIIIFAITMIQLYGQRKWVTYD
ncbi:MAG: sugar ABC transporter permease [Eubacteriales bacterium]|nr:sugar ABC transporter permease [Eubacteriales bacterium]